MSLSSRTISASDIHRQCCAAAEAKPWPKPVFPFGTPQSSWLCTGSLSRTSVGGSAWSTCSSTRTALVSVASLSSFSSASWDELLHRWSSASLAVCLWPASWPFRSSLVSTWGHIGISFHTLLTVPTAVPVPHTLGMRLHLLTTAVLHLCFYWSPPSSLLSRGVSTPQVQLPFSQAFP